MNGKNIGDVVVAVEYVMVGSYSEFYDDVTMKKKMNLPLPLAEILSIYYSELMLTESSFQGKHFPYPRTRSIQVVFL